MVVHDGLAWRIYLAIHLGDYECRSDFQPSMCIALTQPMPLLLVLPMHMRHPPLCHCRSHQRTLNLARVPWAQGAVAAGGQARV